jgi:integrase
MPPDENVDRKSASEQRRPSPQRLVGRLNAALVRNAKPAPGKRELKLSDGGNLFFLARRAEAGHITRRWQFEYELHGKRRWMGLGSTHTFSLADARERARALRQQLHDGIDPLAARETSRRAEVAAAAKLMTFRECARLYLALHESGWGAEHAQQWHSTLRDYAFPTLGGMSVADIDQAAVLKCIEPIWTTKTVTAARVRGRIEAILDYGTASGLRVGDNPARSLLAALPKQTRVHRVEHHAAVPWRELPLLMAELRALDTVVARCLEFTILTASRSGEAAGALWAEIDLAAKVWTVPASRMKGRREHRVPISPRAAEILMDLPRQGERVFGMPYDKQLARLLNRLRPGVTLHGTARSGFRDWARETTNFPDSIVEAALAHVVGDKTVAAYARGDLFDRRAQLMQAWDAYCGQPTASSSPEDKVVAIGRAK